MIYPNSTDERMELKKLVSGVILVSGTDNPTEVITSMIERHITEVLERRIDGE